jgi:hypothetical protein
MKNLFTLALALMLALSFAGPPAFAQCTPDNTQNTPGMTPSELQAATLNQPITPEV